MKNVLFLMLAFIIAGCSSQVVKQDQLKQVKKVALIAIDVKQQKSVSGTDLLSLAVNSNVESEATPRLRTESAHVEKMYEDLARQIHQKTKWEVISIAQLRKNPSYLALFKEKTEGMQSRPMVHPRYDYFQPAGILDTYAIQTSKPTHLTELAKSLGVDAIAYATIEVGLNNNGMFASLTGNGEFRPSSRSMIWVRDARTNEDLFVNNAEGPKVEKGEKNVVGMASEDNLKKLAAEAASLSFIPLLEPLSKVN